MGLSRHNAVDEESLNLEQGASLTLLDEINGDQQKNQQAIAFNQPFQPVLDSDFPEQDPMQLENSGPF